MCFGPLYSPGERPRTPPTYDGLHDEDVQDPVAVEVKLEDGGDRCAGSDKKLVVPAGVGDRDAVSQQLYGVDDHIFRISREPQVKITSQDLLLHHEEVFHQRGEINSLEKQT